MTRAEDRPAHEEIAVRARAIAEEFDRSFAEPAREDVDRGAAALAIHAGGDPYVLLLEGLSGVARRQVIVPLPGGRPAQLGLAGLRGGLVGVFSLPALLGYEVSRPSIGWLAIVAGPRPIALGFEVLDGQVAFSTSSVASAPAAARRHVAGLVRLEGEPGARGVIDLASLLVALGRSGPVG